MKLRLHFHLLLGFCSYDLEDGRFAVYEDEERRVVSKSGLQRQSNEANESKKYLNP